jgi:hypothetical protein
MDGVTTRNSQVDVEAGVTATVAFLKHNNRVYMYTGNMKLDKSMPKDTNFKISVLFLLKNEMMRRV